MTGVERDRGLQGTRKMSSPHVLTSSFIFFSPPDLKLPEDQDTVCSPAGSWVPYKRHTQWALESICQMTAEKQGRKPLTLDLTASRQQAAFVKGKIAPNRCFHGKPVLTLDHLFFSAQSKIQPTYIRREMERRVAEKIIFMLCLE